MEVLTESMTVGLREIIVNLPCNLRSWTNFDFFLLICVSQHSLMGDIIHKLLEFFDGFIAEGDLLGDRLDGLKNISQQVFLLQEVQILTLKQSNHVRYASHNESLQQVIRLLFSRWWCQCSQELSHECGIFQSERVASRLFLVLRKLRFEVSQLFLQEFGPCRVNAQSFDRNSIRAVAAGV